jgi:DNA polymerase III delta prime subunit
MNGNIDTLRHEILNFASSVSLSGGRKYVILDEADYLNANSTQPALRNFMEEFSKNCGFILTCNFKNRIIEPLHSRCSVIDFKLSKSAGAKLASQFFKRVEKILANENVEFDRAVVAEVVTKFFPDWRRVLNELQRYASTGKIDSGILGSIKDLEINSVYKLLKDKDFTSLRKWVAENVDIEQAEVFRRLYESADQYMTINSIPQLVLILSKYQYQAAFVADPEINIIACFTEVLINCEFK